MKTNGKFTTLITNTIFLVLLSTSAMATGRPDYNFCNPVKLSGTLNKAGSKYRFSNVKSGADAIVTIVSVSPGITLNDLDGGGGFVEALQPVIQVNGRTAGHVEFKVDFVISGTTTPLMMTEVPATAIDVDGKKNPNGNLYEYDMFAVTPSRTYLDYSMVGGELTITNIAATPNSVGWIRGKNNDAVEYPGIDTMVKRVMFSVVTSNTTSITFRVGADNQSSVSEERLRSVYFDKFIYNASFLSTAPLISFTGFSKNKNVQLQWKLTNDQIIKSVVVEKSFSSNQFSAIKEVSATADNMDENFTFKHTDNLSSDNNTYYRLKLISTNGRILYSNILVFRPTGASKQPFRVYPTSVNNAITVSVKSEKTAKGIFEVVDYSGRVVLQKQISVHDGDNNIQVDNLSDVHTGNYLVVLKIEGESFNQKIFKN